MLSEGFLEEKFNYLFEVMDTVFYYKNVLVKAYLSHRVEVKKEDTS